MIYMHTFIFYVIAIAIGDKFIVHILVIIEKKKSINESKVKKIRKYELSKYSFFTKVNSSPLQKVPIKNNGQMFK